MPDEPPSLTAYLCRRRDGDAERQRARFEELAGAPPSLSLATATWVAHLRVSPASAAVDIRSAPQRWRAPARRAAKRVVPSSLRTRVRSRLPEPLVLPLPPALLLVRLLILRAGLPS